MACGGFHQALLLLVEFAKSLSHTGTNILQNILSGWLIIDIHIIDVSARLAELSGTLAI